MQNTLIKRAYTLCIVLSVIFCCCVFNTIQAQTPWDGVTPGAYSVSTFSGGSGTASDPYLISTPGDLAQLAANVNAGNKYDSTYFMLIADLDMNNKQWTPIGYNYPTSTSNSNIKYFNGIFDGNSHTIKNIKISITGVGNDNKTTWGLFGVLGTNSEDSGQVKNLIVDTMNISLDYETETTIHDGQFRIGCITGSLGQSSSVKNCIVKNSTITTNSTTYNMDAETPGLFVGGIAGDVADWAYASQSPHDGINIVNCFADVDILLGNINNNAANGQFNVGGIVGRLRSARQYPINCVYTGSIVADGIVGPIFGAGRFTNESFINQFTTIFNGGNNCPAEVTNNWYYNLNINNVAITEGTKTVSQGNGATTFSTSETTYQAFQGICGKRPATELSALNGADNTNLVIPANGKVYASPYAYTSTLQMFEEYESTVYKPHYLFNNNSFSFLSVSLTENPVDSRTYQATLSEGATVSDYTFQWFIDNVEVAGASGSSCSVPITLDDKILTVVVKYSGNEEASNSITVPGENIYITKTSTISGNQNTVTATIHQGDNIITSDIITIMGTTYALTYQWYYNDEPIASANALTFVEEKNKNYTLIVTFTPDSGNTLSLTEHFFGGTIIYVSTDGDDNNDGLSPQNPVKTLLKAYQLLPSVSDITCSENIIVLMNAIDCINMFNQNWSTNPTPTPDYAKNVTITGKGENTTYTNAKLTFSATPPAEVHKYFWGDVRFEHVKLDASDHLLRIYMQGHDFYVGRGVTTYANIFKYEANTGGYEITGKGFKDISIIGGWRNYNGDYNSVAALPYESGHIGHITVMSGNFSRIIGGCRNDGDNLNPNSKNIFGHKDQAWNVEINVKGTSEINLIAGGQCDGTVYTNTTINIGDSSLVGRVVGGSLSFARYSKFFPTNSFFGSTTINISNGTVYQLYGGSLGRSTDNNKDNTYYYGEISINITGGTIKHNVYAAGAGGAMGYKSGNGDAFASWGASYTTKTHVNISGDALIEGDVYGGGYGYSQYLAENTTNSKAGTLFGNTNIVINGATINGSVYGGGQGHNYTNNDLQTVAQLVGQTEVYITNGSTIKGSVFGGGNGITNKADVAKVVGNTKVVITGSSTTIKGNVFGGGNHGTIDGSTSVTVGESE